MERLRLPPHLARSFSLCRRGPSLLLLPLPLLLRPLLPQVPRLQGREHDASPDGDGLQRGGGGGFGGGGGGCYLLLLFFPPKIEKRLVREKLRKRRGLLTHSRPSTTTKHAHAFAPLDITRAHRLQRDASGSRPAAARSHGTRRGRAWGGGGRRDGRERSGIFFVFDGCVFFFLFLLSKKKKDQLENLSLSLPLSSLVRTIKKSRSTPQRPLSDGPAAPPPFLSRRRSSPRRTARRPTRAAAAAWSARRRPRGCSPPTTCRGRGAPGWTRGGGGGRRRRRRWARAKAPSSTARGTGGGSCGGRRASCPSSWPARGSPRP